MQALILDAQWCPRPGRESSPCASDLYRHPRLSLSETGDPSPRPDEVVIEVGACGVCGSDVHCATTDGDGYVLFSGPARLPVVLGHEYAGRVVEVGSEVTGVRLGETVTAEGLLHCGHCEPCRRHRPNQCARLQMVGFSAPGAFSRCVAVPARLTWSLERLAERLGNVEAAMEAGSLAEPLGCAFRGLFREAGGFCPGAHVAVFGCGPIGLSAVLLARLAGAATVMAFDTVPERVALARACGADAAWDPTEVPASDRILAHTNGWGADVMVEAAGDTARTLPEIERAFAAGGTLVYLGRTGGCAPVGLDTLVTRAARIVGSRGHAGEGVFGDLIRLMERGVLDPRPMITARRELSDAVAAIELAGMRTEGKVLVVSR